jgi:hemoglobin
MTAALMAEAGLDEAILTTLVQQFDDRVRAEPVLSPIFAACIPDWEPHLARMVEFWSSVALMTGRYHGSPVTKHADLPVTWAHFECWLVLFRETAGLPARRCRPCDLPRRTHHPVAELGHRGRRARPRRWRPPNFDTPIGDRDGRYPPE